MKGYLRIVSPIEAAEIRSNRIIPTNFEECLPYPAGTVVFLFPAESTPPQYLEAVISRVRSEHPSAFIVSFDADIETSVDRSGWPIAVVHRGPIPLDDSANLQIVPAP